jgi:hypothetical protein
MKKKILFVAILAAAGFGLAKLEKAKATDTHPYYVHWLPTGCTDCSVGPITTPCNRKLYVPICS